MGYSINSSIYSSTFAFPTDVADKYLKFSNPKHIKVLIYIMRKNKVENIEDIANFCDVSEYDVKEALLYWADAGILLADNSNTKTEENTKTLQKSLKPAREDVAKRGLEDPKIFFLLNETQLKLGRNLKNNETSTLVWLYDDLGLDVSLILMIVEYAIQRNKANIRFIESVATSWVDKGIDNITDAEEELNLMAMYEQAWAVVSSAFGIERRKPSEKEKELSLKWVNEWKMSKEMLVLAYEICVDTKSKFIFSYTAKIIESWYKNGSKTPQDVQKTTNSNDKMQGAYDIDLFEKMLNGKD